MNSVAPLTEQALLNRAYQIAGKSIAELANQVSCSLPVDSLHAKGFIGQCLEQYLGADAGNAAAPDFQALGIELKSIPVSIDGTPRESTYVSVVPLDNLTGLQWKDSAVYKKLRRVLWIPIEAEPSIHFSNRRIGMPLLWSPTKEQALVLQQDWEEHIEQICLGQLSGISARQGTYLQIRPKAANAKALCCTSNEEGDLSATLPRGFYLRTVFTHQILSSHYL